MIFAWTQTITAFSRSSPREQKAPSAAVLNGSVGQFNQFYGVGFTPEHTPPNNNANLDYTVQSLQMLQPGRKTTIGSQNIIAKRKHNLGNACNSLRPFMQIPAWDNLLYLSILKRE